MGGIKTKLVALINKFMKQGKSRSEASRLARKVLRSRTAKAGAAAAAVAYPTGVEKGISYGRKEAKGEVSLGRRAYGGRKVTKRKKK